MMTGMKADTGSAISYTAIMSTPTARSPILKKNRTNLDTFAWYTGRLVFAVFDDETPGGPLEFLEVRGQPVRANPTGFLG
jgi:hypothetical protein